MKIAEDCLEVFSRVMLSPSNNQPKVICTKEKFSQVILANCLIVCALMYETIAKRRVRIAMIACVVSYVSQAKEPL